MAFRYHDVQSTQLLLSKQFKVLDVISNQNAGMKGLLNLGASSMVEPEQAHVCKLAFKAHHSVLHQDPHLHLSLGSSRLQARPSYHQVI
mmetsp:Transcript_106715/g.211930  ORF Transcript_106715/g.211930 Transcript_106715/m.211930 type:complete len:89 (+) Transcript_106715:82-348(+)